MKGKETSVEELNKALAYLDELAKGKESVPVSPSAPKSEDGEGSQAEKPSEKPSAEDEPDDELYMAHKKRMASYIDKAMCHKGYMDSIKKGDPLPDGAFDDLDEPEPKSAPEPKEEPKPETSKEEPKENVQKGQESEPLEKGQNIDELVKARVSEEIGAVKSQYEEVIKGLQEQIKKISDEPVRKTLIKGADAVTLKAAISGEKIDDKTVLSVRLQKGKVSEALYNAYENEKDEVKKGILGDAVSQFECTGNYISPEALSLMDQQGFKFID